MINIIRVFTLSKYSSYAPGLSDHSHNTELGRLERWRVVIAGTNRREIKTNAGEETSVGHQLTVPLVISSWQSIEDGKPEYCHLLNSPCSVQQDRRLWAVGLCGVQHSPVQGLDNLTNRVHSDVISTKLYNWFMLDLQTVTGCQENVS